MTAAHGELAMFIAFHTKCHDVNSTTRVLFKRQRLHNDEVLRICWQLDIDEFVNAIGRFEEVRVGVLAQFAFEVAPEVRGDLRRLLSLLLQLQPVFEAQVVDETNGA